MRDRPDNPAYAELLKLITSAEGHQYLTPPYAELMLREARAKMILHIGRTIPGLLKAPEWLAITIGTGSRADPRTDFYHRCIEHRRTAFERSDAILDVVLARSAFTNLEVLPSHIKIAQVAHLERSYEEPRYKITVVPDETINDTLPPDQDSQIVYESDSPEDRGGYIEFRSGKTHEQWHPDGSSEYRSLLFAQRSLRKQLA